MNLIDRLQILTGRKLSEEEMRIVNDKPTGATLSESKTSKVTIRKDSSGKIVKNQEGYTYARTEDASHADVWHTGYYSTSDVTRVYDENGLLLEKHTSENLPFGRSVGDIVELSYRPAGSFQWHTKKITRTDNLF